MEDLFDQPALLAIGGILIFTFSVLATVIMVFVFRRIRSLSRRRPNRRMPHFKPSSTNPPSLAKDEDGEGTEITFGIQGIRPKELPPHK